MRVLEPGRGEYGISGERSGELSSFGSFVICSKDERVGRTPKTGEDVPIPPRRVMVSKPSNILKARIKGLDVDPSEED